MNDIRSSTVRQPQLGAISTKTLTERLRMLEAEGWVTRHYEPTIPPPVTYAITKRVLELDGVMTELDRIAERWYGKNRKATLVARPVEAGNLSRYQILDLHRQFPYANAGCVVDRRRDGGGDAG